MKHLRTGEIDLAIHGGFPDRVWRAKSYSVGVSPFAQGCKLPGNKMLGLLLDRPRRQRIDLLGAFLVVPELEVVAVGRAFPRPVSRVGERDPIVPEMGFQLLERIFALGDAAVVFVAEIAELVAEQQEHAIALRHVRDSRTLGAARPLGPVLLHQNSVDVAAHRKPERLQVLLSGLLLIRRAVADIEYFDA